MAVGTMSGGHAGGQFGVVAPWKVLEFSLR
jgi:hypothetical protein